MAGAKRVSLISPVEQDIPVEETSFKLRMPRYGVLPLTAALKDAGYEVRLFCEYSGSRLDWRAILASDYVLFSLMSFSACRGYRMADRVRRECRAPVVIGGPHASVEPADCLQHADFVVRNEGEGTLLALLDALEHGRGPGDIAGVSYRALAGAVRHNPPRGFLDKIDRPVDLRWIEGYAGNRWPAMLAAAARLRFPRMTVPIVQTSRGCARRCEFCQVKYEFGTQLRFRDPAVVADDAARAMAAARSRMLFIADNDFAHDEEHALEVIERLIARCGVDFSLYFFACLDLARRPRLLAALARLPRVFVGIGLESIDDATLREFRKGQNERQIDEALETLARTKFALLAFFVFSGEVQTAADVRRTVDFAIDRKFLNISLCSLTDYPSREAQLGVPQVFPDHRFIHRDWRFYNGNFVLHFPRRMKPSTLQREIYDGYRRFYRANRRQPLQLKSWMPTVPAYARFLERAEAGLYDEREELREDRLLGRGWEDLAPAIDVRPSAAGLLAERFQFYAGNLLRPAAWRMLFSLAPGDGAAAELLR